MHALDPSLPVVTDIEEITGDPDIDIVVELIGREHPALEYMKKALLAGKNVVTANKDVVAVHGKNSLSWQQPTMSIFFLRHRWLGNPHYSTAERILGKQPDFPHYGNYQWDDELHADPDD